MKHLFLLFTVLFSFSAKAQITLDPCINSQPFTIVVLGSSTAAGAGPSHPDSAWVNKYRTALQKINPQNQVINLAVGGFTTYKIMPDNFVAPTGRPAVNPQKNITHALSLQPDAIIVNLPSNDRQWPMQEQLANFDSLYHHSWNNGVPMYICTTQPITSAGAYQKSVADSLTLKYSPYVIDFFTPLADTNNLVYPHYAADAVHLNDSGHVVLYNQVYNKDILKDIFKTKPFPDLMFSEIILPSQHCVDSAAVIGYIVVNLGDTLPASTIGKAVWQTGNIQDSLFLVSTNSMNPCQIDTLWIQQNFGLVGNYALEGKIVTSADSNVLNNQIFNTYTTVNSPALHANADTLCANQSAIFMAQPSMADTLLWYASLQDTVPLQNVGTSFNLIKDTVLFAQAVAGKTTFAKSLVASETKNINFNGNMFNLVAHQDVVLDSIVFHSFHAGNIPVNVYLKPGSYQGFESTASAWTLFVQDTAAVLNSGDMLALAMPNLTLTSGDTMAFYIQMEQNYSLQYQSSNQPVTKSTPELSFLSGAGIAFNFGTAYPNRTIAAKFYYSYGFNRLGDCATELMSFQKIVSAQKVAILPDTILPFYPTTLVASQGFANYVWVKLPQGDTISTTNMAIVDSTLLQAQGASQVTLACFAQDKFGCISSDTSVYTLARNFGISTFQKESILVYPNPNLGVFKVTAADEIVLITVWNVLGQMVKQEEPKNRQVQLDLSAQPSGFYVLMIQTDQSSFLQKIEKR